MGEGFRGPGGVHQRNDREQAGFGEFGTGLWMGIGGFPAKEDGREAGTALGDAVRETAELPEAFGKAHFFGQFPSGRRRKVAIREFDHASWEGPFSGVVGGAIAPSHEEEAAGSRGIPPKHHGDGGSSW